MPLKIIDHGTPEYHQMVDLRLQVLRKPLGMEFSEKELQEEKNHLLIGAFEEDEMLGCCMLTKIGPKTVRLRQMAVKMGLQGKGIGRVLMSFAENIARDMGNKKMVMHARESAKGFYEKQGYKTVSEKFEEVTIPHFVMEKEL